MKKPNLVLACDEDCGTGIPKALALVGYSTHYILELGWAGKKDVEWLPIIGQNQWLLFSYNKKQLTVPSERNAIIQNKVGVIYMTDGQQHPAKVLYLLLKKWGTIESLWETTEKPFARFLHPDGAITPKYRGFELKSKETQGLMI